MEYLFWLIVFVFGAALGSFVNVVADRYNTGLAWWKGGSFCFSCNARLRAIDLVPAFSFLFLRGRCRYCQLKIPNTAFWVEIIMGAVSLLIAYKLGIFDNWEFNIFNFQSISNFLILNFIFGTLLLIAVYDLRHYIIPDAFLGILFVFSALHLVIFNFQFSIFNNLIAGILLPLPFLILFLISGGRWLGLGDVKYIAVLGLLLGFAGGLSAVLLSFWIGAGFTLLLLFVFRKNLTMKSEVPFGPFLSLGAALSLYFGLDLLHLNEFWSLL